jgi:Zn-dependent M28 family amino/carboxypeptidase
MPMDVTPERRQHLARYSGLRYKAMAARDRGAVGLIVVSGPTSGIREPLVPLQMDGTLAGSSLAVISISDSVAETLLKAGKSEESLEGMQKFLDRGELMMGFPLEGVSLSATIDVQQIKKEGRNVLGWLRAGSQPSRHVVVVGAHIDHLGTGQGGSSLARDEERGGMHRGADDNASGVAGMLEIAQFLAAQKRSGKLSMKHDILFAAWSGEELGLLGSDYFAEQFDALYPGLRKEELGGQESAEPSEGEGREAAVPTGAGALRLAPTVAACFNLDMIGRLRDAVAAGDRTTECGGRTVADASERFLFAYRRQYLFHGRRANPFGIHRIAWGIPYPKGYSRPDQLRRCSPGGSPHGTDRTFGFDAA